MGFFCFVREAVVNCQASIASALTAKRSERQEPLRAFGLSETPRRTSQSFPCGKRKKDLGQNPNSATVKMHHFRGMNQISTNSSMCSCSWKLVCSVPGMGLNTDALGGIGPAKQMTTSLRVGVKCTWRGVPEVKGQGFSLRR